MREGDSSIFNHHHFYYLKKNKNSKHRKKKKVDSLLCLQISSINHLSIVDNLFPFCESRDLGIPSLICGGTDSFLVSVLGFFTLNCRAFLAPRDSVSTRSCN